ncbi:MAG: hypothetical protein CR217_04530 [Beijerinckiaceae bacterium]|nr:MAG: hypothetical protein CR217_04530 [Beijerinckiaceae bacterium]
MSELARRFRGSHFACVVHSVGAATRASRLRNRESFESDACIESGTIRAKMPIALRLQVQKLSFSQAGRLNGRGSTSAQELHSTPVNLASARIALRFPA